MKNLRHDHKIIFLLKKIQRDNFSHEKGLKYNINLYFATIKKSTSTERKTFNCSY